MTRVLNFGCVCPGSYEEFAVKRIEVESEDSPCKYLSKDCHIRQRRALKINVAYFECVVFAPSADNTYIISDCSVVEISNTTTPNERGV